MLRAFSLLVAYLYDLTSGLVGDTQKADDWIQARMDIADLY
jgi:hypothetical protein